MWKTPDGKLHIFFQFNDRGRGPKTTTVVTSAKNGIADGEVTDGNDYLKADVHEEFSSDGASARWKNKAEQGNKKFSGDAFYVSMYGPPQEIAFLARAALAKCGKAGAVTGGGESRCKSRRARRRSSG
jgi:hypothetical protein